MKYCYIKSVLTFLLFFVHISVFAQNKEADSLIKILKTVKRDTTCIRINHELFVATDDLKYVRKNLKLSKKINYQKGIGIAYRDFGRFFYFDGEKDKALNFLNKSVTIAEKLKDKKTLISAYRYIGYIYQSNDPMVAKEYYEKSLKISREVKDEMSESYALSAIGVIYEGMLNTKGNYEIALKYYLKSLEIRQRLGEQDELASSLNETARTYNWLKMYDKSTEMNFRGLELAEKIGDFENIYYISSAIGNDYAYRLKDYKKALYYKMKAYNLCINQKESSDKMFVITKMIAYCYSQLGDINQANKYYRLSMLYDDTTKTKENLSNYNLSNIKRNLEKELSKQKSLLKNAEISKQKSEAKRQTIIRNLVLGGCLFLIVLVFYILKSYRKNQKINQELDLRNQKIQSVNALVEKQKQTAEKNNVTLQKLLDEKEILFKEIHHRVKNNLQIISSLLNLQSNAVSDKTTVEVLKQSQSRINTMAILHNKLYQTEDFTNVSIEEYLKLMLHSISDSFGSENCKIEFEIHADADIELNIDMAIPFGLILNELTTNSFKHAFEGKSTGKIYVLFTKMNTGTFQFIYKDNGVGLPENYDENLTQSLGLELIEMLVQQLNGSMKMKNDNGAHFEIAFVE